MLFVAYKYGRFIVFFINIYGRKNISLNGKDILKKIQHGNRLKIFTVLSIWLPNAIKKKPKPKKVFFQLSMNEQFTICVHLSVIDCILGCGERNGNKYFLVKFRGERQNSIIDWETAKNYSLDVMEFFGSRLVWSSIDSAIDPEMGIVFQDEDAEGVANERPSTSGTQKPTPPNNIEYDD